MESVQFRAMNTDIILAAEGSPDQIRIGFDLVTEYIHASERKFTRFSENSELSRLNKSGGDWFQVSPEMIEVILLAQSFAGPTHGLFNPAILPDLHRIGYDRSMDLIRTNGVANQITLEKRLPLTFDEILIRPEESLVSLPVGLTLDLGGIAKGWIAEQAAYLLAQHSTTCLVSAGGDMRMLGLPSGMTGWEIELEDPRSPGDVLVLLNLPPGAVATSSVVKRTWKQGNLDRHHLIDPRTGEPANASWLSVTVIANDTPTCEVFAKALLIATPTEALEIAQTAGISFLAVDQNGHILGTPKSLEYIIHES